MTENLSQAPVVLAADGTASSEGALRFAVEESRRRDVELVIVHVDSMVVPPPHLRPVPEVGPIVAVGPVVLPEFSTHARGVVQRTAREAAELAPDLAVSTILAQAIASGPSWKRPRDAQLVVVGRETHHGLERVLTGATRPASHRAPQCPVVVVPGDWQPRRSVGEDGVVVVGIRRVADAADLMETAYAWAASRGASIIVVHAWEMVDGYLDRIEARIHADEWQAAGEHLIGEALGGWRDLHPDVSVETRVAHGHAATVLAAAAKTADLLVVRRAHEHRPFDHLGATVRALLLASRAPVEVVPRTSPLGSAPDRALEASGSTRR